MTRASLITLYVLSQLAAVLLALSGRRSHAETPTPPRCHAYLTVVENAATYYELVCPVGASPRDSVVDTR